MRFLASDSASFVTGSALVVDGGMTVSYRMTTVPASPRESSGSLSDSIVLRTIARRLLLGLLTLFLVSVVVFAATQLLPGDAARAVLGRDATPDRLAAFRRAFHLNDRGSSSTRRGYPACSPATQARRSRTGFRCGRASSRGS